MRIPVHAYESWHSELPNDPIKAMHKDRQQSVFESEKKDWQERTKD